MQGTLIFDEQNGNFCIVDTEEEKYLGSINFGDEFEVSISGQWIKTAIEISNNKDGELEFKLKNTNLQGNLDGNLVRKFD